MIIVMKGKDMKFVRQSQTIKVTNVDNKVQTEKEIRKHGNMLPISIRGIICGPSNCSKTNVLISAEKSTWHMFRKRVRVRVFEVVTAKIPILGHLLTLIEELIILHSPIITI